MTRINRNSYGINIVIAAYCGYIWGVYYWCWEIWTSLWHCHIRI